jgi:hypothetical protein
MIEKIPSVFRPPTIVARSVHGWCAHNYVIPGRPEQP